MHSDYKIGLAVGLSVVGLVAAMFFRRESPVDDEEPPPLNNVASIDKQVAEDPRAPYINIRGLDDFADASSQTSAATATQPHVVQKPAAPASAPNGPGAEAEEDKPKSVVAPPADPDPLRSPQRHEPGFASETPPAHNRDWQPSKPRVTSESTAQAGGTLTPAAKGKRTHRIEPGDTLTRIAEKYLGDRSRYREIYNANRDRLRSADDLPEGVALVIPDAAAPAGRKPAEGRTTTADPPRTRMVEDDEDSLRTDSGSSSKSFKLEFEPVRRRPFAGGNQNGREASHSDRGGRIRHASPRMQGIDDEETDPVESEDDDAADRLIDQR